MITKYNLFTVNKWIFTTLKSIMYKKTLLLAMHLCQNSAFFALLDVLCLNLSKKNQNQTQSPFRRMII